MSTVQIRDYRTEYASAFAQLNLAWIEQHFSVEEPDRASLLEVERHIIAPGGNVLFAVGTDNEVLGCVALKVVQPGVMELTKMAVDARRRGHGIGAELMRAALRDARARGTRTLLLDTHSSLRPAIALYQRFGFRQVPLRASPYRRSDVSMELDLNSAHGTATTREFIMDVQRLAAFSAGNEGGNGAGVWIGAELPDATTMQAIAAEVGYSETAFAAPLGDGWRVRYFAPGIEVDFCGHATIALGAALALRHGDGQFKLSLNHAGISVSGRRDGALLAAELSSPPTRSAPVDPRTISEVLDLFGYSARDLDARIAPARAHGGADHLVIALHSRDALARMHYDQEAGRRLMEREGYATLMWVHIESDRRFNVRNAFAIGGIYEDPATGAAAAAFAGYLRDIGWPHGGAIDIVQGADMGSRSLIHAEFSDVPGSAIRVSGTVRQISN
jgi:PhzF family phenazine biosynthesis protein